jgi:hypothetical protein
MVRRPQHRDGYALPGRGRDQTGAMTVLDQQKAHWQSTENGLR